MTSETVLRVCSVTKSYGTTRALDGASLELRRGEWVGLLGPNGAGKTTLVRSVASRVRLDSGHVELLGRRLSNGSPAAERSALGVVPQEIALYPLLTARENLAVFARLHGVPAADVAPRVRWALEWTGLAERAAEPVGRFSGGMKRRLNIACGVLHRPGVVLLDEPTVGVDPQSRERIWAMLAELRAAGASLLLTTHQLDEAQKVCERIVIIDHGRAVAAGTLDELVAATIGRKRQVTLTLDRPLAAGEVDGLHVDGRAVRLAVDDVAAELPGALQRVQALGRRVQDVAIEAPSLSAVFLHLTGQELRE